MCRDISAIMLDITKETLTKRSLTRALQAQGRCSNGFDCREFKNSILSRVTQEISPMDQNDLGSLDQS